MVPRFGWVSNIPAFTDTILTKIYSQDTKVIVVSATCGGGMIKMSTAGSTNTTSGKFYIMEDGRIMGGRGHIHGTSHSHHSISPTNTSIDGGVAMHMFINDQYVCSSKAEYGYRAEESAMDGKGHGGSKDGSHGSKAAFKRDAPKSGILTVANMTDCVGPWKVKKGDSVVLKAEYDLKKHPL
jgi:hypothetical protein